MNPTPTPLLILVFPILKKFLYLSPYPIFWNVIPHHGKKGEYELDVEKSESLDGTKQDQSSK